MTMIEQVARAMSEELGVDWPYTGHEQLLDVARAAIKAMREPTDAMAQSGGFEAIHHKFVRLGSMNERDEIGRAVFAAMIDAALEEGK